ncbi:uncharacterized protein TNCT_320351 [Trichonephila clavata]|uniref:Uncharacterized protein n=1 Tax=Trichonephila clavata TaxID=2740835 RepID=A0A8X6LCS6_TRICU|nr:uncharacterized protein TNCT_320351 [Trichonephila clavata]
MVTYTPCFQYESKCLRQGSAAPALVERHQEKKFKTHTSRRIGMDPFVKCMVTTKYHGSRCQRTRHLPIAGFDGFEANHLKFYLSVILDQKVVRHEYRFHIKAVRALYRWFESQPKVSSLTGTDSGCVVFLTLLQLYMNKLQLMDDEVTLQVHLAKRLAEGFLHRNANYYKGVRNVTEVLLQELGNIYVEEWQGKDWTCVANEQLARLMNNKT